MDLLQGLMTRRSVRQFARNRSVPKQDMKEILEAAMYAPSGRNTQPWEFIVVDDKELCKKIIEIHPYSVHLNDSGLAVIVCGDLKAQMDEDYWSVDCAAATENLLLACHAKGLGSCWCSIYPNKERLTKFSNLLNLPPRIQPFSLVVIGYPSTEPKQPNDRYKPSKIHHNGY